MFEYDKDAQTAAEKLDEYDLKERLIACYDLGYRDPFMIRERIVLQHPELEDVMDNLSNDEFMEYLCKRYHVRFDELVSYRLWYNPIYR